MRSSTVDLRLSQPLGKKDVLEPHYRYYDQQASAFYAGFLVSGQPLPAHASADYRLGAFHADTFGLAAAHSFSSGTTLHMGLEYYLQRGDSSPPEAFGALAEQDLFPDVSAWMVRLGASVPIN